MRPIWLLQGNYTSRISQKNNIWDVLCRLTQGEISINTRRYILTPNEIHNKRMKYSEKKSIINREINVIKKIIRKLQHPQFLSAI